MSETTNQTVETIGGLRDRIRCFADEMKLSSPLELEYVQDTPSDYAELNVTIAEPLTESQCQESEPLTQENRKPHECFLAVNTDIFSAGPPICFKNVSYNQPDRDAPDGFEWRKFAEVIPPEVKERPDSEGVWWKKGENSSVWV